MERAVALKKLGQLLGKKLGYRVDTRAPTPDERAEAKVALTQAIEERNKLKEQRDARYRAILAADAEYQNLFAAARDAGKRVDELSSITRHRKITAVKAELERARGKPSQPGKLAHLTGSGTKPGTENTEMPVWFDPLLDLTAENDDEDQ